MALLAFWASTLFRFIVVGFSSALLISDGVMALNMMRWILLECGRML